MNMAARVQPSTPKRSRQCLNVDGSPKVPYSTRDRAKRVAKMARRDRGEPLDTYECGDCGYWHVGHRQQLAEQVHVPRLQRSRSRELPAGVIYVGRPTAWGNPYKVGDLTRTQAVEAFRLRVERMEPRARAAWLAPLRQAVALACWCPLDGEPCHADVLLEWLAR